MTSIRFDENLHNDACNKPCEKIELYSLFTEGLLAEADNKLSEFDDAIAEVRKKI